MLIEIKINKQLATAAIAYSFNNHGRISVKEHFIFQIKKYILEFGGSNMDKDLEEATEEAYNYALKMINEYYSDFKL